jgi:AhpD family alkylhydroperoxidase
MSWKDSMSANIKRLETLKKEIPEAYDAFEAMGKAAKKPGAMDEKTKEYIALAMSIATQCESCIAFHTRSLIRLGANREEFCEGLAMIGYMGAGPGLTYGAKALEAYDEFTAGK